MKLSFLFLYFIIMSSCNKDEISNHIWTDGQTHFQITDSLVFFNHGPNRDYYYKIKGDSIFLSKEFCRSENFSFQMKVVNEELHLTGFNDFTKSLWNKESYDIDFIKKYKFYKQIEQDYKVSSKNSIQKQFKKSKECIIQGDWYNSLTKELFSFETDSVFYIKLKVKYSAFSYYTKVPYRCFNQYDFFLIDHCANKLFEFEFRNDTVMKVETDFFIKNQFNKIDNINLVLDTFKFENNNQSYFDASFKVQ